jgi:hypothetical protein
MEKGNIPGSLHSFAAAVCAGMPVERAMDGTAVCAGIAQKIVRYQQQDGAIYYGVLQDGKVLQLEGGFAELAQGTFRYTGGIARL